MKEGESGGGREGVFGGCTGGGGERYVVEREEEKSTLKMRKSSGYCGGFWVWGRIYWPMYCMYVYSTINGRV